tara:strand:- start:43 stop:867 length:825 start_codon:yes stop_codon:yes gene_type:complete
MKHKHNKKRNTAFLFESLIREITKAALKNDDNLRVKAINILKEFFSKNKILADELELYKTLYQPAHCTADFAQKIINEAKVRHKRLNKENIFQSQTNLIIKINKDLGKNIFENFIPNYKNLATIYQVLYEQADIKKQISLEEKLKDYLQQDSKIIEEQKYKPVSKLAFRTFYNKFNETYGNNLLREQKELINHYISSFERDDLELKVFLNEEITRLRSEVHEKINLKKDSLFKEKKNQILAVLESFSKREIDNNMIEKVLKIQQLLKEIDNNGN